MTRLQARQLRAVFRRALPSPPRRAAPAVELISLPDRLQIRARQADVVVAYELPGAYAPAQFVLPQEFLRDCEGAGKGGVELDPKPDGTIAVRWQDADLVQERLYDAISPEEESPWPALPHDFSENPSTLVTALRDASETADPESSRFALGQVQLRGARGEIAATDGRQLLLQGGFVFPWTEEVLIARNHVFAAKELQGDRSVEIGYAENWVTLRVGPWTLQFAANLTGRFPRIDDLVQPAARATSSCHLSPDDLLRLQRSLKQLPAHEVFNSPVTLELNGRLAVRAKAERIEAPTELALPGSRPQGAPLRIATNRCYLERAAKLGLNQLHLFGPQAAILAQDERRSYVWMPLASEQIVPPRGERKQLAAAA